MGKYIKDPRRSKGIPMKNHFVQGFKGTEATDSGLIVPKGTKDKVESNALANEFVELAKTFDPEFTLDDNINISTEDMLSIKRDIYNRDIVNLDKEYTSLRMLRGQVLIRLFKKPAENRSGLLIASTVRGLSDSQHNKVDIPDPFRMLPLGIVVNMDSKVAEVSPIKVGDFIQLELGLEKTISTQGVDRILVVPNSFATWDKMDMAIPWEGYVLWPSSKIIAIVASTDEEKEAVMDKFYSSTVDRLSQLNRIKANESKVSYTDKV